MALIHEAIGASLGLEPVRSVADLPEPNQHGQRVIGPNRCLMVNGTITLPAEEQIVVAAGGALIGRTREADGVIGDKAGGVIRSHGGRIADLTVENTSADSGASGVIWSLVGVTEPVRASGLRIVGARGPRFRGDNGTERPQLRLDDCVVESTSSMIVTDRWGVLAFRGCRFDTGLHAHAFNFIGSVDALRVRFEGCEMPSEQAGGSAIYKNASATLGRVDLIANDFVPLTGTPRDPLQLLDETDDFVHSLGNHGLADG